MAWYQCTCGALKEEAPQLGDTIVSIYHLHHSARFDGGSAIVRMQEIPAPVSGDSAIRCDEFHTPRVTPVIASLPSTA